MLEKIVKNIPVTPTTPNMAFLVLNEDRQTYTRYVSDEQGKVKKVQSSVTIENSDDIIAVKTDTGIKFSLNPNNQSAESVKIELNQAIENVKNNINSNLENKLEKGNYTGTAEDLRDLITDLTHIVISDDATLNSLKSIVSYIKQNRETLDTLSVDNIAGLPDALGGKVDKIIGKQLSDENFTTTLKEKLEGIDLTSYVTNEVYNRVIGELTTKSTELSNKLQVDDHTLDNLQKIITLLKQVKQTVDSAVTTEENFTTELKEKLEGLDLQSLSQEINTIKSNIASNDSSLDTIQKLVDKIKEIKSLVDNKVSTDGNKQLSTEDFTTELKNKLEGINLSDYATILALNEVSAKLNSNDSQLDTLQKVVDLLKQIQTSVGNKVDVEQGKSLSTNDFTTPLKQKLEGIDMDTKVDKVVGKQLSQEDFTTALKTKLDNLRDSDLKAINILSTSFNATRDHVGKLLMYDNNSNGTINFNAFTERDWCFVMNATNGTGICTIQSELNNRVLRKDEIGIVVKWGRPELTYLLSLDYLKPNTIRTVDNQERKFKEISRADYDRLSTKDPNVYYMIFD